MKMDHGLHNLLLSVADEQSGESYTHETLYGPSRKWTIKPNNHNDFWNTYCNLVYDVDPNCPLDLCIAERPQEQNPIISKLRFRYQLKDGEDNENWEPYNETFLKWLCFAYQSVILENFKVTESSMLELCVVVLESTSYWYETDNDTGATYIVMDIRLQFPYSRIDLNLQSQLIKPKVIELLRQMNVLKKIDVQPVDDWNQIISMYTSSNSIPMYGSKEHINESPLKISHIWSYISTDMLEESVELEEVSLDDAFNIKNHIHVCQNTLNITEHIDDIEFWIPLCLSVGYWPSVLFLKNNLQQTGRLTDNKKIKIRNDRVFGMASRPRIDADDSDIHFVESILRMLDKKRFTNEPFWMDLGMALYNADNGSDVGLAAWIRHTEKQTADMQVLPSYLLSAGSISNTCKNLYYTFSNSNITIKTIAWYAREDSPHEYAEWHKDWCMAAMEQALSSLDSDVALALYRVYWLDFVYAPNGSGKWFQFKNNRWYETHQGMELKKCISGDFRKRFENARTILSKQIHDSTDEGFKTNGEITIKKITGLIGKLKTYTCKCKFMAEAAELFKMDKFSSLLDANVNLTGITNGVLEVYGNTIHARPAKPEDYVSMSTGIPYHDHFDWDHPLVKECMKWFGQVFPDELLMRHFLKFAASCLKGKNSDKIFPIWTGDGDNSKSMIVKLFEATFNTYCIKFPVTMISEKGGNSNGPSPQLARAKNTRVAFLDEPEDDVPMTKGNLKRWTGGDSFFGRLLNENGGDIVATFKMILICNKVPVIPNADKAIKNRTRLFPYLSTWVNDPPESEDEQIKQRTFKMDTNFDRRIPILAPAFLWIIVQYYSIYAQEGLNDPPIVKETTDAYWRDNDVYAQFAADTIQEVYTESGERDPSSRVTLTEIYDQFKSWFRDAFPGTKLPERTIVRSELTSRWGRMIGNAWHGIQIINNDGPMDITSALGGGGRFSAPNSSGAHAAAPNSYTNHTTNPTHNPNTDNISKSEQSKQTDHTKIMNSKQTDQPMAVNPLILPPGTITI